jgi:hypothetical protein
MAAMRICALQESPTMAHLGIVLPQRSKETLIHMKHFNGRRGPHIAFSLDFTPTGFYLLGSIKGWLKGRSFQDAGKVVEAVGDANSFIRPSELDAVSPNPADRVARTIR